jgi:hypothetical protein
MTFSITTTSIMTFRIMDLISTLSINYTQHKFTQHMYSMQYHYAECCYAECHGARNKKLLTIFCVAACGGNFFTTSGVLHSPGVNVI